MVWASSTAMSFSPRLVVQASWPESPDLATGGGAQGAQRPDWAGELKMLGGSPNRRRRWRLRRHPAFLGLPTPFISYGEIAAARHSSLSPVTLGTTGPPTHFSARQAATSVRFRGILPAAAGAAAWPRASKRWAPVLS
ncbi:hypothetical protein E2562_015500 [Oryza meyeriana var. granulata]|uniref:Uncharacterized protein n=1 Tax=Oryza meyeriana var. granulata TaxID=110450 RepID=A0A6G1CR19_9ORYZ|nr:hypothetical protein E2562_015500 [Oryza meyeriana var. granulata]